MWLIIFVSYQLFTPILPKSDYSFMCQSCEIFQYHKKMVTINKTTNEQLFSVGDKSARFQSLLDMNYTAKCRLHTVLFWNIGLSYITVIYK